MNVKPLANWCKAQPAVAGLTALCGVLALALAGVSIAYFKSVPEEEPQAAKAPEDKAPAAPKPPPRLEVPPPPQPEPPDYLADMRQAVQAWQARDLDRVRELLDRYLPKPDQPDQRAWEWHYLATNLSGYRRALTGHVTRDLLWSPDGSRLVSFTQFGGASASGAGSEAKLWNPATGKMLAATKGQIAFSPDSQKLFARYQYIRDYNVQIFDARTGAETHSSSELGVWSPDFRYRVAVDSEKSVKIWDSLTKKTLATLGPAPIGNGRWLWSPDSKRLALWEGDSQLPAPVTVWSGDKWELACKLSMKHGSAREPIWSKDGSRLRSDLGVWDAVSGKLLFEVAHQPGLTTSWSPDARFVATRKPATAETEVWDATTGKKVFDAPGIVAANTGSWSPTSHYLLLTSLQPYQVGVWEMTTGKKVLDFGEEGGGGKPSLTWSPDGQRLFVTGNTSSGEVWSVAAARRLCSLPTGQAAWSPCGRWLLTRVLRNFSRSDLVIRDGGTGLPVFELPKAPQLTSMSPDGSRLACADAERPIIEIWEIEGRPASAYHQPQPTNPVEQLWSPDLSKLAYVRLWLNSFDSIEPVQVWDTRTGSLAQLLAGGSDAIVAVSWSPDGKTLATGGPSGLVQIWRGNSPQALHGHSRAVKDIAWSPNGKLLATCSGVDLIVWEISDSAAKLVGSFRQGDVLGWSQDSTRLIGRTAVIDVRTGQKVLTSSRLEISPSPDRSRVAVVVNPLRPGAQKHSGGLEVHDVAGGAAVAFLESEEPIMPPVSWNPDGKQVAARTLKGTIKVWQVATSKEVFSAQASPPESSRPGAGNFAPDWSPAGTHLAVRNRFSDPKTRMAAGDVIVFEAATGKEVTRISVVGNRPIDGMVWHPQGRQLAVIGSGNLRVWDAAKNQIGLDVQQVGNRLSWSPDGRWVSGDNGDTVRFWEMPAGKEAGALPILRVYRLDPHRLPQPTWSPDGQFVLSGPNGSIRFHDLSGGKEARTLGPLSAGGGPPRAALWSPDNTKLAVAGEQEDIRVWDVTTWKELAHLKPEKPMGAAPGTLPRTALVLAWTRDGKRLASADEDGAVSVWSLDGGQRTLFEAVHGKPVHSLAWSPDGTRIASAGLDGKVKISEAGTGKISHTFDHVIQADQRRPIQANAIGWSPDGSLLAVGGHDGKIVVRSMPEGKEVQVLHQKPGQAAVAWSPDGRRLATSCGEPTVTVTLWHVPSGTALLTLEGGPGKLVWSMDGLGLCSGPVVWHANGPGKAK